jgi:hypothetical protein
MTTSWKVVGVSVLALGQAFATDPTKMQDPPGKVDVDQPAGVSLSERNTERDATDTLRGGGRTDVIDGERAGRASGPAIRASEAHGNVQPGTEARASFEGGTGSAAAPSDDTATRASDAPANDTASSTSLGADAAGYGTGTERAPTR